MATSRPTKALEVNGIFKKGHFDFAMRGVAHASTAQAVHDGDTVGLSTALNFSSRFLGVDAPEISFTIRTKNGFVPIGDPRWVAFWTTGEWKHMPLSPALLAHLTTVIGNGDGVAANHKKLADQARAELMKMIAADLETSGKTQEDFRFFLSFSYEFLDQYGRMLCYLNAERDNFASPQQASKLSYNERMLTTGTAVPFFIYPNLQPFMGGRPFDAASLTPAGFWAAVNSASRLKSARKSVAAARTAGLGVFAPADPLILLPYELRFIARLGSTGPDRYVIDLGATGGDAILEPDRYFTIANLEDRLFIPAEFVPLFTQNGWQVQ